MSKDRNSKELKAESQGGICSPKFTAELPAMAVTWEQPKPMDKWINQMWLDLEDTQSSGRSQALADNRARFPVWELPATPLPDAHPSTAGRLPLLLPHGFPLSFTPMSTPPLRRRGSRRPSVPQDCRAETTTRVTLILKHAGLDSRLSLEMCPCLKTNDTARRKKERKGSRLCLASWELATDPTDSSLR